ncbi:MAG: hypothetical protein ACLFQQ_11980 [Desulfococcaceae bacterium]
MTDAESRIPRLAAAYKRLAPGPLPPEDPQGVAVEGILEPTLSALFQTLERSPGRTPVRWTAVGGTGVSTLLGRLIASDFVTERYHPVFVSLAGSLHLLDARPADLEFIAYLALADAAPAAGIDPGVDNLRKLLGASTRKGAGAEELRPHHLRRRLRADGRFRAILREELEADPDRLSAALAELAGKFSRNTVGAYQLTEDALRRLREAEVSDRVLEAVAGLMGRSFRGEVGFFRALENAVGELQALHYKPLFLEHAWAEAPRDPLLVVDDIGKLGRGAAETLFGAGGLDFSARGIKLLAGLPPRTMIGDAPGVDLAPALRPTPLRDREGRPDPEGVERLREVLARRLDPDIAPGEALTPLIQGSGGVLRDLLSLARKALARAAAEDADRLSRDLAAAAVQSEARLRTRFLDRETHGNALERIAETRTLNAVPEGEAAYLLRYGFVLPNGPAEGDPWFEPAPAILPNGEEARP